MDKLSDILVDQIRTIDYKRLNGKLGGLAKIQRDKLKESL